MKKSEQLAINTSVLNALATFTASTEQETTEKQLRTCSATVASSSRFDVLKSYNTVVAIHDKKSGVMIDILRYAYGFTRTSAQHISKFENDYCKGAKVLTYKEV